MELKSFADLHIHTTYSDGTATVPDVLARAAASNLQVIAITDHDAIAGALEARQFARDFGVEVIVGEEVSTAEGHVLALSIEDLLPPGRPAAETIAAVHAQGGLCVAPHPYDWAVISLGRWGFRERCRTDWRFDAVEAFNASLTWPRSDANRHAQHVALELNLPAVGGSDAHSVATIGAGFTRFIGTSADDLYRSIKAGHVAWGAYTFYYGQSTGQVGHYRGERYWCTMTQIYQQAFAALRPGGSMLLVIKDDIRAGQRVPTADQTVTVCTTLGFLLRERYPRRVWPLSLWQRRRREHGQPVIEAEDILVFRRPSGIGDMAHHV